MVDFANAKVSIDAPAFRTRGSQAAIPALFNNVENLNVTSHAVNQRKKGPFTQWLHRNASGVSVTLEDILPDSAAKELLDDGYLY